MFMVSHATKVRSTPVHVERRFIVSHFKVCISCKSFNYFLDLSNKQKKKNLAF